jgi:hypothetical protein
MAKKRVAERPKNRSGPRAPVGKRPLMVILNEKLIEDAKIAAIQDKTKVSAVVEELLRGWLAGRKTRK